MSARERAHWSAPFHRAIALTSAHPQVVSAGPFDVGSRAAVQATFRVNLPSESKQLGVSPSGVRLEEPVRFEFPGDYPMQAPELSLRADFSRNHPHIQPWLTDGRPVPCIYEGDIRELLHQEGFAGLLNQTALWLDRAAAGDLIDPEQGWEPVRRDSYGNYLVGDADFLRSLVSTRRGYRFCGLTYVKLQGNQVYGRISDARVDVGHSTARTLFSGVHDGVRNSLALVVWPPNGTSRPDVICDSYRPETVDSLGDLMCRAVEYSCAHGLESGLMQLRLYLSRHPRSGSFSLAVILLARRPFHLIGSQSPIELCPYVIDVVAPDHLAAGDATPVRPAAHLDPLSRPLLVQMNGGDSTANSRRVRWTLIGAGSLGSKIALHLARAGQGPEVVVDSAIMSPHNAARHALVPGTGAKARLLCEALRELDQSARPVVADAGTSSIFRPKKSGIWSNDSWAMLNTTASLSVHEALSAARAMKTRAIEASLFSGGRVGLVSIEGPNRNPNSGDLMAEFYADLWEDPMLASEVFARDDAMTRQAVGQGCGTVTMPMSDGRVSLFAAGMAEYLLGKQRDGLPCRGGELLIGRLSDRGLSVRWEFIAVAPVTVVAASLKGERWRIHIHARAEARIQAEMTRWNHAETGGVLMGRISEASRTVHIVDVVDAPEDSVRTPAKFVLGMQGLRRQLETFSSSVDWSLCCLGTWHSHLSAGGPSHLDRATAEAVSLARLTPSVFLILATDGYHAILGDAADVTPGELDGPVC